LIIEMHNPERLYPLITHLRGFTLHDLGLNIGVTLQDFEIQQCCAFFHLADVMDTTRDRVSGPAYEMLEALHKGDSAMVDIRSLLLARQAISDVKVVPNSDHVEVVISTADPKAENAALARIGKENADLVTSGAKHFLEFYAPTINAWPFKLEKD
jgi:hypothetical protein